MKTPPHKGPRPRPPRLEPERSCGLRPPAPHLGPREACTSAPGGLHLHRLGLDPHDATALLLNLDVLRDHALLRRRYLLYQDTQDLVPPLKHLLQHRVLQIYRSEKGKMSVSGLVPQGRLMRREFNPHTAGG